jgi:hypothetical protein
MLTCYKILTLFVIIGSTKADSAIVIEESVLQSSPAEPHEFKYQVCLRNITNPPSCECSGALLNPYYVLTVPACASYTHAVVGVRAATPGGMYEQQREIVNCTTHRMPNAEITLLELSDALTFNDQVKSIPLVSLKNAPSVGEVAVVSGWGATENNPTPNLMKAEVTVVNETVCNSTWNDMLTPGKICAWINGTAPAGMAVLSEGDLGNPLTCKRNVAGVPTDYLCGLALKSGRETPDRPDLYASIAFHNDWILGTMKQEEPCGLLGEGIFASKFAGKYFRCEFGPTGWLRYVFQCPVGQTYDEDLKACKKIETPAEHPQCNFA